MLDGLPPPVPKKLVPAGAKSMPPPTGGAAPVAASSPGASPWSMPEILRCNASRSTFWRAASRCRSAASSASAAARLEPICESFGLRACAWRKAAAAAT